MRSTFHRGKSLNPVSFQYGYWNWMPHQFCHDGRTFNCQDLKYIVTYSAFRFSCLFIRFFLHSSGSKCFSQLQVSFDEDRFAYIFSNLVSNIA